ncbi:hypothetical protein F8M41_026327 [Gigaspora margarita]|uniref:Uncharacterized protein n=1 Tax=Gigaspora margarita TaxID=4874 RepID=A0A8H4A941_GIGMA|nr:hypothetical protein F8M41_026327 [Gigaspora margarita]
MNIDNNKVLDFIFQLIVVLQLISVAILYANVLPFPDPPAQEISNVTGLPIWAPASTSFEIINDVVGLTEYIAAFITGALSVYCVYIKLQRKHPDDSNRDEVSHVRGQVSHTRGQVSHVGGEEYAEEIIWTKLLFNTIVTGYIIVTFIALIAGIIFQLGKLWSAFGIYHNVLELCLAAALLQKGTFNYIIGLIIIVVYSISVVAITSQLDWYWDAVFFKFQGLILDFLLPVLFIRVAVQTHSRRRNESQPLLGGNSVDTNSLAPQYRINILVAAAIIHLVGNIANVVGSNKGIPALIFNLSYFIAFPLYAIYVHQSEKSRTKYIVPETSLYKFILLAVWAITASSIASLLSFYRHMYGWW